MMEHSSCGMGLQLKMAMSQLEEWLTTTNPLCSSMIQQATKASRQVRVNQTSRKQDQN